jgi:hypothetical protein
MGDIEKEAELVLTAFRVGYALGVHACEKGIPLSKVKEVIPNFQTFVKQAEKALLKSDDKEK